MKPRKFTYQPTVTAVQVPDDAVSVASFIRGYGSFAYEPGWWLVNDDSDPNSRTQIYTDDEFRRRFCPVDDTETTT